MNRANLHPPGTNASIYKTSRNHTVDGKTRQKHRKQLEVNETFPACYLYDLRHVPTSQISASLGYVMGPVIMSPLHDVHED